MKEFKAESKKVLDIMINSIYTHKEIFLRELISNANDALDKLFFLSAKDSLGISSGDLKIFIELDKEKRTIMIADNGIGMSKEELENNLGVIAKSGSEEFKNNNKDAKSTIIGQFGVGFYSSFMVSKKVEVLTKKYGSDEAYLWSSEGIEGYNIKKANKEIVGSTITLYLKDDVEGTSYSDFLEPYKIKDLVTKYSNYIKYPIQMDLEHTHKIDGEEGEEPKYEKHVETETLNSMIPLWKKNKQDVKEEEIDDFYQQQFFDYEKPLVSVWQKVEGAIDFTALLFIPSIAPYNYYYKDYEKGLKLYVNNVLIMDKCKELIPDHFSFVNGIVDCDLDLNISRETIQKTHELTKIAQSIEKKIKNELTTLLTEKREDYEKFFKAFGLRLKFACYEGYGANKDKLQDLLMFNSLRDEKLITLKEYLDLKLEDQKYIYYCVGKDAKAVKELPLVKNLLSKNMDCLLLTEEVDEFVLRVIHEYEKVEFKSINETDLNDNKVELNDDEKKLNTQMKDYLKDKVVDVIFTDQLSDYPLTISSEGDISIDMEKSLNNIPQAEKVTAKKVLQINRNHPIFKKLLTLIGSPDVLNQYSTTLYQQARLIAGLPIEESSKVVQTTIDLLSK